MIITSLHTYPAGHAGTIVSIDAHGDLADRMHALGLTPGRFVRVMRRSPWHGPIHIRAGQTDLILRREEAALVRLRPVEPAHAPGQV